MLAREQLTALKVQVLELRAQNSLPNPLPAEEREEGEGNSYKKLCHELVSETGKTKGRLASTPYMRSK